jgi:cytochrome c biogenesis protein
MKIKLLKYLADLRFAISILLIISFCSIIGTVIEQDQSLEIYKLNYPITNKLFGFLSWETIIQFGFDHVYTTWWFLLLLIILGISLIGCTISRQFPLLSNSKEYFFRKQKSSFLNLPFSLQDTNSILSHAKQNYKERNDQEHNPLYVNQF